MAPSAGFGTTELFLADARIALGLLNHWRYQALQHTLGISREQANVVTAVIVLGAADATYESVRRVAALRPRVGRGDAAIGVLAVREAGLGIAGPNVRKIPGLGVTLAIAMVGAAAGPRLRQAARRMRAAEQAVRAAEPRIRRERMQRYEAARERARASAASA